MIRKGEVRDIPNIFDLIMKFYQEGLQEFGMSFDWATLQNTIKRFIENEILLVAEENDKIIGLIGGITDTSMFDNSEIVGQEAIWYVLPEYRQGSLGIELLKAFENACKEKGAKFVIMKYMENINPEKMEKLYKINQYKRMETLVMKGV